MHLPRLTLLRAALVTGLYAVVWSGLTGMLYAARSGTFGDLTDKTVLGLDPVRSLSWVVDPGGWIGLYCIGACWLVYLLEWAAVRLEIRQQAEDVHIRPMISVCGETHGGSRSKLNPFSPAACYYTPYPAAVCFVLLLPVAALAWLPDFVASSDDGVVALRWDEHLSSMPQVVDVGPSLLSPVKGLLKFSAHFRFAKVPALTLLVLAAATAISTNRRVRQSLTLITVYSVLFGLLYFLAHLAGNVDGDIESDLPAGGGNDSIKPQTVKVQKVVRKKYVINPYSSILFAAPPPIDQIELKFAEETAHQHKAGSGPGGLGRGDGKGGGFGSGTGTGKYELVRLQHSDKSWNKNFGIGGDRNLLAELKAREPLVKINEEDRSIDYNTLARASAKKPFPLVYVGGTSTFAPSEHERKILREYLIDKHGMILGDNLGGHNFHHNFVNEMTRITGVPPVEIPRDDRINQRPYELPLLPILVSHAPKPVALGWKIDGRWAVYYHPGALSDLWRDDHAGAKKAIWESGYQLGINILFYAYVEQDKWRQANQASQ